MERLDRTLVVLASKAGVSLEGDAYRRIFSAAFRERGLSEREIAGRFLVITDHGSPLHDFARQCGYRIGLTDPYLPGTTAPCRRTGSSRRCWRARTPTGCWRRRRPWCRRWPRTRTTRACCSARSSAAARSRGPTASPATRCCCASPAARAR
ncbi:hypothetical protein [Actinomadura madurae]|uniref:hypothetical protein n=1 Tax=Actinomadura madurae TaxID=1993 RepID=UPI0020D1F5BE|nr:hypothetical protein [Actinomadura madurae]MCP9977172.1 hypothetical protein [Actinomadura madurae]